MNLRIDVLECLRCSTQWAVTEPYPDGYRCPTCRERENKVADSAEAKIKMILDGIKTCHGLHGDHVHVCSVEGRVALRSVAPIPGKAVVVAFSPAQARELAAEIMATADSAEAQK